jgi:Ca2+-binding RTX toxin-like protein
MATFTIGSGGNFATITAALASGSVVPGDTLALLSGYNTENATVEIENLTFSGDASNTDIALTLSTGIMAITLTGTAPIAVTGNESNNSITGNDGSNVLAGGEGNDSIKGGAGDDTINGGAGADTIYYTLADDFIWVGDGIDSINGGTDHDTLIIEGTPYFEQKGYGGENGFTAVVVNGTITGIGGGTLANVESVVLDLGEGYYDALDYSTIEAVTVDLATGTATGFTSIAGVENVSGGSGNDALTGDAGNNILAGGAGDDTLIGGDSFDRLDGGDADDNLDGGAGDDWLRGSMGLDTLTGGTGFDQFTGNLSELNGDRIIDYELGEKIVLGEASLAEYGNARLVPAGADTQLQIDGDNDGSFETVITLNGTISGTIVLSNSGYYDPNNNNMIRIVTSVATSGNDLLFGTPVSADVIDGLAGDDEIFGLAGNDTLIGGTGNDRLGGGDGNDDLSGGDGDDFLWDDVEPFGPYGTGDATLEGGGGSDRLYGNFGDDVLTDSGTDGSYDFMGGGSGNDILSDAAGPAELHGAPTMIR